MQLLFSLSQHDALEVGERLFAFPELHVTSTPQQVVFALEDLCSRGKRIPDVSLRPVELEQ